MALKCVPLNPDWTGATSQDLRAIYRRKVVDNYGQPILDADGREQWDTTGPLPLRRHNDWDRKGYEYITLADEDSLGKAAPWLRAQGLDPHSFIQDRRARSPFSAEMWMQDQRAAEETRVTELRGLIAEFGVEAVVKMRGPLPAVLAREVEAAKPKRGRPRNEQPDPEGAAA